MILDPKNKNKKHRENDKLKKRTIDVANEFCKWLDWRDSHRNDNQTVTIKGIFAPQNEVIPN